MEQSSTEQMLVTTARRRDQTDYRFDWWTYIGWNILTLGNYSHYATYRLVERRGAHAQRRLAFSSYLWHTLAGRADSLGRRQEVQEGLDNLSKIHAEIDSYDRINQRESLLWLVLRFIFTPVGVYINHFLNADLRFLDAWETSLAENTQWVMQRLGVTVTLPARTRRVPERSTGVYVLLTIITFGLFAVWWRYATMEDGNAHFDEDAAMEDAILAALGIQQAQGIAPPLLPPMPRI